MRSPCVLDFRHDLHHKEHPMIVRLVFVALFYLGSLGSALSAETKQAPQDKATPRIAVLDMRANGVAKEEAQTLTGVLLSGLAKGGGINLISKDDLKSIFTLEQAKLIAGCPADDPRCVAEHGHALGDAILVWGSVGKVGDKVVITVAAVDIKQSTTIGRGTRTVDADDGDDMIEAVEDLSSEIRAALGLQSEATWEPIMAISIRFGGILGDYMQEVSPDIILAAFELETDVFITQAIPLFLRVGLKLGGGENDALFVPATFGVKYRFIRPWLTPYIGMGVGLEFLDFSDNEGGVFSLHILAGLELNPWKRFGFSLDGGFNFSRSFATKNFTQFAGELHLGLIYRF